MSYYGDNVRNLANTGSDLIKATAFKDSRVAFSALTGGFPFAYIFDTVTGELLSTVNTFSLAYSMAFIGNDYVGVATNFGGTPAGVIEVSTGLFTTIASVPIIRSTFKMQQFAGDIANSRGLYCSSTSGQLVRIGSGGTGDIVSVSGAASQFNCIVFAGSNTYWVGDNVGKVREINHLGTVSRTIDLTVLYKITSLAHCPFSDKLFIGTQTGIIFQYDLSSSTLDTQKYFLGVVDDVYETGPTFSNVTANGVSLMTLEGEYSANFVTVCDFGKLPFSQVDEVFIPLTTTMKGLYLDVTNQQACWASEYGVSISKMNGLVSCVVPSKATKVSTELAQRLYRIVSPKEYRAVVESDQNLAAGLQNVTAQHLNIPYIDIGSIGTIVVPVNPVAPEQLDIRRFPR